MNGYLTPQQLLEKYREIEPCSRWSTDTILDMFRHFHIKGIYNDDQVLINENSFLKFIDSLSANPNTL